MHSCIPISAYAYIHVSLLVLFSHCGISCLIDIRHAGSICIIYKCIYFAFLLTKECARIHWCYFLSFAVFVPCCRQWFSSSKPFLSCMYCLGIFEEEFSINSVLVQSIYTWSWPHWKDFNIHLIQKWLLRFRASFKECSRQHFSKKSSNRMLCCEG